jgi:hypothetical protein
MRNLHTFGVQIESTGLSRNHVPGNESLFSLQGQVQHKIRFIEDHVPPDFELTLVGHSMGCHIILSLLKHFESLGKRTGTIKSYMLFPMIEHMYETPNGWWSWIHAAYLLSVTVMIARLLALLPTSLKAKMIRYDLRLLLAVYR